MSYDVTANKNVNATITAILIIWGLVENHLSGCFCPFAPKYWEGGGDLRMTVCKCSLSSC